MTFMMTPGQAHYNVFGLLIFLRQGGFPSGKGLRGREQSLEGEQGPEQCGGVFHQRVAEPVETDFTGDND